MSRLCGATLLLFLMISTGHAHFPFIVPASDSASAKVVFSDDLSPDANVNIEKIANTKLVVRDGAGKESALEWKKSDGFYTLMVPGSGTRVVYGTTTYGVLQKGDTKPFLLTYYPKAVLGTATSKEAIVGDKLPLEIVAAGAFGKVKFQVLAHGKPQADIEVGLLLPGSTKKTAKTDQDGYTMEFDEPGRYGVTAKRFETKTGDYGGKKYEEIRDYATLVCDIAK